MKFFKKFSEIICNFIRGIGAAWVFAFIGCGLYSGNFDFGDAYEIMDEHFGLVVIINIIVWVLYYNHERISRMFKKS